MSDYENAEKRDDELVALTVDVISAYVAKNAIPVSELPMLISMVYQSLTGLGKANVLQQEPQKKPAANPKRSVHDDYIICLEDGEKFKSLKRHLATHHGLTPEDYRTKWNLPSDYPMVARSYAAARSTLAKKMGLGRKPKETAKATGGLQKKRGRKSAI